MAAGCRSLIADGVPEDPGHHLDTFPAGCAFVANLERHGRDRLYHLNFTEGEPRAVQADQFDVIPTQTIDQVLASPLFEWLIDDNPVAEALLRRASELVLAGDSRSSADEAEYTALMERLTVLLLPKADCDREVDRGTTRVGEHPQDIGPPRTSVRCPVIAITRAEEPAKLKRSTARTHGSRFETSVRRCIAMQSGKCCYCESGVPSCGPGQEIEHYWPKAHYGDKRNLWSNLLLACDRCNRKKDDSFPLDELGQPLVIDPTSADVNPESELTFLTQVANLVEYRLAGMQCP